MSTFREDLKAAGHVTTEAPTLVNAPVTTSGYYLATNGYWYSFGWNGGRMTGGMEGVSPAYKDAEEALAYEGVIESPEQWDKWERGMRLRLGL